MKKRYLGLGVGVTGLLSIGCTEGLSGLLLQFFLVFLGATPSPTFGQTGEVEFNLISQTGEEIAGDQGDDATTEGDTPEIDYEIRVSFPEGTTATLEEVATNPSEDLGTFSVLLDSSGSMENSFTSGVCDT